MASIWFQLTPPKTDHRAFELVRTTVPIVQSGIMTTLKMRTLRADEQSITDRTWIFGGV
jgi:hypothetical protein